MKSKNIKRKIIFSLTSLGIMGTIVGSSIGVFVNKENSISKVSNDTNATTLAADTAKANLIPWNQTIDGKIDLTTPRQYITFDNTNSSYAILNSSTKVSSTTNVEPTSGTKSSFDQISRYDANNGNIIWTKKTSDIDQPSKQKISNGKILATQFLQGTIGRDDYLLSLVGADTNKIYILAQKWSDGTQVACREINFNSEQKDIKQKSTSTNDQYFININNFIDLNFSIIKISSEETKVSISSCIIDSNYFVENKTQSNVQFVTKEIANENFNKFFASSSVVSDFYSDNNNLYFAFQQNSIPKVSGPINNYITLLKIGKNQLGQDISSSNLMSFSLSSEQAALFQKEETQTATIKQKENNVANSPLVTFQHNKTGENYLLISQSKVQSSQHAKDSDDNVYLVAKYNNNDFQNITSVEFSVLNSKDKGFVLNLNPLYADDGSVLGYIGLSSTNKAIHFSKDFSTTQIYYDFETLSVASENNPADVEKKIFNLYTRLNDANWYVQMIDGSIIQFSGTNLIGQLDRISSQTRKEILAKISFKEQSEIDPSIIFADSNDENFINFVSQNSSKFLNILSNDPVFGEPIITAKKVTEETIEGKNKNITLGFYQTIRQRDNNGTITNTQDNVWLGNKTYKFINNDLDITTKEKNEIPSSITSKYPSQVSTDEVKQILSIKNTSDNYEIALQPNDAFGTLTVNLTFPYAWVAGSLQINYKQTVNIGTPESPFFMVDLLNGLDSSVNLVTDEYLTNHNDLKNSLTIKYASVLPSQVSLDNVLNDFVVLGDAFSDMQLINQELIEKPTTSNIQVVPVDTEGYMYVNVTIPKVGDKTNVVYSFKTASIFSKSATSQQNAYIVFKEDSVVNETQISIGNDGRTEKLSSYSPSKIATQINSDKTWLLYFADISYYVLNLIYSEKTDGQPDATLNISTNDGLGQITIGIQFSKNVPGMDGKVFQKTFSGFARQGNSGAPTQDTNYPTFSWGKLDANEFNGKTPADITVDTINNISSKLFVLNGASSALKKDVKVSSLNASGAVLVTVTFYNWWEKKQDNSTGSKEPTLLPQKTFQTVLTNGLRSTKDPVNSIVWKSYSELGDNIRNSTAANALVTINNSGGSDIEKLKQVANVSQALEKQLTDKSANLALSITANNSLGYIEAYVRFNLDGKTLSFGTKISGFNLESSNYVVTLASDTSQVAGELKDFLPSQLTDEQIGSLVDVQLGNNFSKRITTKYDDINGTLTLKVELFKTGSNGESIDVIPSVERMYTGFKTNIPQYKGTNFLIVGLSIGIPIVLLLSPILFIVFYKNKKDIRRFAKVLDKRLSEQEKKKKHVDVNSIEDLLSIEND